MFGFNQSQVNKLNLSLMSPINNSRTQTAFTVSIDAKKGESQQVFQLMIELLQLKLQLKKMFHKKILYHLVMFFLLFQKMVVF